MSCCDLLIRSLKQSRGEGEAAGGGHLPAAPAAFEKCSSVHEVAPSPAGSDRHKNRMVRALGIDWRLPALAHVTLSSYLEELQHAQGEGLITVRTVGHHLDEERQGT